MAVQFLKVRLTGEVIVVAFDICSSSDIVEEFTLKSDLPRLQRFLTALKRYLMAEQQKVV